jgi:DNA-binding NarL/FixJ family response regulator
MARPPQPPVTRVLIADSHAVVRSGVRLTIEDQPDMRVVAEAIDAPSAMEAVRISAPDVAVVQLELPGGQAVDTIRELLAYRDLDLVLIADSEDPALLHSLVSGRACAVLSRRAPMNSLPAAIRAFRMDPGRRQWFPADFDAENSNAGSDDDWESLTPREQDVAGLVAEGLPYRDIAARLGISEHTVKNHLRRIYDKLDINNRVELAVSRRGAMV